MKPLSRIDDGSTLQELGKASIQIVHDLKNQLNGLKLYATFLRRRIEKSERPEDEQKTIGKLISGLDRAANDLSLIAQFGQPIELKRQPGFDIQKAVRSICSRLNENGLCVVCESEVDPISGNLDPTRLTDAFTWISKGAVKYGQNHGNNPIKVLITRRDDGAGVGIEWSGMAPIDHDPFRSFAGSDEIRMSLAAKIIEAHGGSVEHNKTSFLVTLPLSN